MRGNEVRFCLLNFPGKFSKRQKISLSSNFPSSSNAGCFQQNFPGNLEDKSVCMGNEGNPGFTFPFRTMKIEVIMVLP